MQQIVIPAGASWELLIVDNNSSDDTDAVIDSYQDRLPIRKLLEKKQGHSNSRNCAVAAATGDWLLWTDDDVLIESDWLANYVGAATQDSESVFFGGPVVPWFETDPPAWLMEIWEKVKNAYAIRDLGALPIVCTQELIPFGANFAVRLDVQKKYLYDPMTGRRGTGMVGGDETSVLSRIMSDGLQGRWIPNASVQHFLPKSRLTLRYLRSFYFGLGQTSVLSPAPDASTKIFGKPRWLVRKAFQQELSFRRKFFWGRPEDWIQPLIDASVTWGQLYGSKHA